jgi:hypothetical protein
VGVETERIAAPRRRRTPSPLTICRRRFLARSAPAKFLATVEAADAEAAVEAAAKEFKADPKRLIAVRRAEAGRLVSLVH